jgi:Mn2+/Fe2+ NRAMP family transporter
MGDFEANAESGARFGMRLAWVVVVGVVGICIYAEMGGRVATMSRRPVFDIIRERLGARWQSSTSVRRSSFNLLTLAAEVAGLALVIELVTGLNYILWVPLMAVAVTNSKALNAIAFVYLVILLSVSIVTIPLLVWTRGGA